MTPEALVMIAGSRGIEMTVTGRALRYRPLGPPVEPQIERAICGASSEIARYLLSCRKADRSRKPFRLMGGEQDGALFSGIVRVGEAVKFQRSAYIRRWTWRVLELVEGGQ